MLKTTATILAIITGSALTTASAADVTVTFENIQSTEGTIRLSLCTGGSFSGDCRNATASPTTGSVTFTDVAPGTYAIQSYHDENGNGDIDMGFFGPKEPWGYSTNPRPRMGPNTFDDAAFEVNADDVSLTIQLR